MAEAFGERLCGKHSEDRKGGHFHAITERMDAMTEFVVIRKMIDQRLEAIDFSKMLFRGGHRCTQREIDAAQLPGREYSRVEVRRVAKRFHFGHKSPVRDSAVETSDRSDLGIREGRGNRIQIARRHADIAVADD